MTSLIFFVYFSFLLFLCFLSAEFKTDASFVLNDISHVDQGNIDFNFIEKSIFLINIYMEID